MKNLKQSFGLEQILGKWHTKRIILDKYDSSIAHYRGLLNVSFDFENKRKKAFGNTQNACKFFQLKFFESGFLQKNNKDYPFSQTYRLNVSKSEYIVQFNDGRAFFKINKIDQLQAIDHICDLDNYIGKIKFINKTAFSISFFVSGPNKNYYLKALYKR